MKLSDKKGVQLIVRFLADAGIKNVVLSPGSRNAPLSLSFANHGGFDLRVIPDERAAAYHALGISLYSRQPAVICCTSGTAVLNYAPAIAEAFYQHIPLLVITADRPEEWIDQGDGQTIRQQNVFANYIEKSFSVSGDASSEEELDSINVHMNEAINIASLRNRPVHINVTLEEPLYKLEQPEPGVCALALLTPPVDFLEDKWKEELQTIFSQSAKTMILAGQMHPDTELNQQLIRLSQRENTIVLTENTSNLHSDGFICCIDRAIDGFSDTDKEEFKPDLLITIGGAVVSKKVKAWLRKYQPRHHFKIGREDVSMDTYRSKTHTVTVTPGFFIKEVLSWKNPESGYQKKWRQLNQKKISEHHRFLSTGEFSDLTVFSSLLKKIPSKTLLHLGNSSPIRYAQLFDSRADLFYFSNRGVSGIDGCTSTAAGMADVSGKGVTLISGDISFFYDSNAFWNDHLKNLKVIVINNGGGGIFRIIDQPENIHDTERLFETRHSRRAEGIARAFGIGYFSAVDEISLEKSVKQLYADNLPAILEIVTPTEKNPLILKHYFSHLKNN